MKKCFSIFFIILSVFSSPLFAEEFNRLPHPQFELIPLGNPQTLALNGGIGDGADTSFFCGGTDEANSFRSLGPNSWSSNAGGPNTSQNQGTYQFVGLLDHCRTEGVNCGDLYQGERRQFVFGYPKFATNCHPFGKKRFYDGEAYQSSSIIPGDPLYSGWEERNYVFDGEGFVYGRYLISQVSDPDWSDPQNVEIASAVEVRIPDGSSPVLIIEPPDPSDLSGGGSGGADVSLPYDITRYTNSFLDIPYNPESLKYGFICPVLYRAGAYRSDSRFDQIFDNKVFTPRSLEPERKLHYVDLLSRVRDKLAYEIATGTYLDQYIDMSPLEVDEIFLERRKLREIVVYTWNVLDEMLDQFELMTTDPLRRFTHWAELAARGRSPIELKSCTTPDWTLVEYDHEESRICISPEIRNDCLSKRAMASSPDFNLLAYDGDGDCDPSYGYFSEGGLFERDWNDVRGYVLYLEGDEITARSAHREDPADGYSPVVISMMMHQLVHAYEQIHGSDNHMSDWPVPHTALFEEEQAVLAQALGYSQLCELGYCPFTFEMKKKEFIRNFEVEEGEIVDATSANRYSFPHTCRGKDGIFLGPLCSNMFMMSEALEEENADLARMLAYFHSMGPLLETPERAVINGREFDFYMPRRVLATVLENDEERNWYDVIVGDFVLQKENENRWFDQPTESYDPMASGSNQSQPEEASNP